MSGEQILRDQTADTSKPAINSHTATSRYDNKKHNRVDINVLLSKVREEKKKQSKENLVFFGLISSVIIITGIIASL